MVIPLQTFTT